MKTLQATRDGDVLTLAIEAPNGEPPTSFTILGPGSTDTTKGVVLFDAEASGAVIAAFADHGMDQLPIDYDHGMLSPLSTPETASAAGWFRPTVGDDGSLVATDVQWTPRASDRLRNREYRYFSPAVHIDPDSGRVRKLVNLALTNLPATKGQKPLVANQKEAPGEGAQEPEMQNLLKLLGAKDEAEAMTIATAWDKQDKQLLTLTGTATLGEAMAAIEANAKLPAEVALLSAKLTERDKADAERERDAVITELCESGKLPPALKDWAKTQTPDSLRTLADGLPVLGGENHEPPKGNATKPDLTDEDRKVMNQMGLDEDKFIAVRSEERKGTE